MGANSRTMKMGPGRGFSCALGLVLMIKVLAVSAGNDDEPDEYKPAYGEMMEWSRNDYYGMPGIEPNMPHSDLKRYYRRLSLQLHPDKNPGSRVYFRNFSSAIPLLVAQTKADAGTSRREPQTQTENGPSIKTRQKDCYHWSRSSRSRELSLFYAAVPSALRASLSVAFGSMVCREPHVGQGNGRWRA